MDTYWNDLSVLRDISKEIEESATKQEYFNNDDVDDFKESISYFIEDWLNAHIKLYKEYDFEEIMYESLYGVILENYGFMVDSLNFDLESKTYSRYYVT